MDWFTLSIDGRHIEISSIILAASASQDILATYPVDKLTAVRLIAYAYLMVMEVDNNPFMNIDDVNERSGKIQEFLFGTIVGAVDKPSVKALIKQFKLISRYKTKRQRVTTARLVVSNLKKYIESFDIASTDVEGMKNFSELGIKLEKNEAILADAEKALTAAVNVDIEEGNFVAQIYD